jgi:hypothetical protein
VRSALRRLAAGFAALLLAAALPALAQEIDAAAVTRVGGFEGLQPLDARDLGLQRGGQLPRVLTMPRGAGGPVRFWDEVARPPRPNGLGQQGSISSTSRGAAR